MKQILMFLSLRRFRRPTSEVMLICLTKTITIAISWLPLYICTYKYVLRDFNWQKRQFIIISYPKDAERIKKN